MDNLDGELFRGKVCVLLHFVYIVPNLEYAWVVLCINGPMDK